MTAFASVVVSVALAAAPPALSPAIRASIAAKPVDAGHGLRFWMRSRPPEPRPPAAGTDRFLVQRSRYSIREGAFVGVLESSETFTDAKGQQIAPGLYTLRYALQPLTKDHHRVSPLRDFLLLLPAAVDRAPSVRDDLERLWADSRGASATGHPAVIELASPEEPDVAGSLAVRAGGVGLRLRLTSPRKSGTDPDFRGGG